MRISTLQPMNTLRHLTLASTVAGLFCLASAVPASAFTWGGKLDMTVVAEQENPQAAPATPTADHPAYYVAYDAGYIEAGDPIGGEKPPAPAAVAEALHSALASQHYLPATATSSPSLVLVYHWGLLNRDTYQIRNIFQIQPNLRARISLVSTKKYAKRIIEDLMDRRQPVSVHIPIIDPTEQELLQLVHDNRYFVIVSAFDYASVTQGRARLVWRVKLSTRSAGAAMREALPTLLRGGAPYFGRNVGETEYVSEPLVRPGQVHVGTPQVAEYLPPPEVKQQVNQQYLDGLMHHEHVWYSGEVTNEIGPDRDSVAPTADPASESFLPPGLTARIHSYEQEKASLQEALATRLKGTTPGPEASAAIDAFNRENAKRIAALTAERRAIRDELARLAAANTNAEHGKTLQALQQEFAAGVHELESENGLATE